MQNTHIYALNGTSIHFKKWIPDGEVLGSIVLIHGLGEHIDRYQHVAAYFNQRNIAVYGFDLPGHGRSGGKRGHIDSFMSVYEIINQIKAGINIENPGKSVFVYSRDHAAGCGRESGSTGHHGGRGRSADRGIGRDETAHVFAGGAGTPHAPAYSPGGSVRRGGRRSAGDRGSADSRVDRGTRRATPADSCADAGAHSASSEARS